MGNKKLKSLEYINLRSEEVQEILSRVPNWMIRWGSFLFLILIILLLMISWVIKYPDIIKSEAIIMTQVPYQKEFANVSSKIDTIYVKDKQKVEKNEVIVILENTANNQDVFYLKSIIDTISLKNSSISFAIQELPMLFLGDVEKSFSVFENNYLKYIVSRKKVFTKNIKKKSKEKKIIEYRKKIQSLKNTIQSLNQLKNTIKAWEDMYILKSKIDGVIVFPKFWNKNQPVKNGDLIFSIIPTKNLKYFAKLKTPSYNSGKIKVGQNVNISLRNFPKTEFGILKGTITDISFITDKEGFYTINVSLPKKMITNYNKKIKFKPEMKGSAEIITEDLRLLERFLYRFKSLLYNK